MECLSEAGIPDGVVNLVLGDGPVGAALAGHPDVDMVAFTGSTATGREIMRLGAGTLKRLLLELGGKAPFVVCGDADCEAAVEGALWGAYYNSGQVCMAATRFVLHESVYDQFAERFVARTRSLRLGPALDPASELGPMLSAGLRDRIEGYVARAIEAGTTVLCGGEPLREGRFAQGFWVTPTVFGDVDPGSEVARDEIFGPVVVLQRFETLEEAVRIANDTRYGLAGSVWTRDLATALSMAEQTRAGYVWVNDHLVRAPGLPFGGWQQSGFGREACPETLDEFSQVKTVHIDQSSSAFKPRYRLLYAKDG
jgi:acyl-CoA reductase-like NAD-dependent aldehyde dehydrogenase